MPLLYTSCETSGLKGTRGGIVIGIDPATHSFWTEFLLRRKELPVSQSSICLNTENLMVSADPHDSKYTLAKEYLTLRYLLSRRTNLLTMYVRWCYNMADQPQRDNHTADYYHEYMTPLIYWLTPRGSIRTNAPSHRIGPTGPLDRLLDRFWIWKRFWEDTAIGYKTGTGY
jgi:hypothetical protein